MSKKLKSILAIAVVAALVIGFTWGSLIGTTSSSPDEPESIPSIINYQGTLLDPDYGFPVGDGEYTFVFSIYEAATDGVPLWQETQTVSVSEGLFSVLLGSVNPLTDNLFSDRERYLGVKVGDNEEMSPRQQLSSVPYAFQAETAKTADKVKQLIHDFVVASGESVTAGDVVGFLNGYVQKGFIFGNTITHGSEYVFNAADTNHISAAALSSGKFVVAYSDAGNSNHGTAVIGNVSGTTITYGSEYKFNAASSEYISAAALSEGKFVVAYKGPGAPDYGAAVIGTVSLAHKIVGIAREPRTEGQEIPVIIGGVSDVHSGLAPGITYYSDLSGDLTTVPNDYRVGLAISSTEILLDITRY